jgi:hypothetical protein
MGVFTIAQMLADAEVEVEARGKSKAFSTFTFDRGQVIADGAVVCSGMRESLASQLETGILRN